MAKTLMELLKGANPYQDNQSTQQIQMLPKETSSSVVDKVKSVAGGVVSNVKNWLSGKANELGETLKKQVPTQEQITKNQSPVAKEILTAVAPGIQDFIDGGFSGYIAGMKKRDEEFKKSEQEYKDKATALKSQGASDWQVRKQLGSSPSEQQMQDMVMGFMNPAEGLGSEGASLIKGLAKEKAPKVIETVLSKMGVEAEKIPALAKTLAKTSKESKVGTLLSDAGVDLAKMGETAVKVAKDAGEAVSKTLAKGTKSIMPKRLANVAEDVAKEDFTNIPNVDKSKIKSVKIFGSSVEGKAIPNDVDVFVTVADDAAKFKKSKGGLTAPIVFDRGKFSYIVMPESEAQSLLDAMLYTGRKDADRLYSGTAVDLPKSLWKAVSESGGAGKIPTKIAGAVGEGSKGPERKLITRLKEAEPTMEDMLKGKYERRSTQELVDNAIKIIKENPVEAERMARTGTDDQSVAVAIKMVEDFIKDAKAAKGATQDALYSKAAEVANEAARNLTEAGRSVQAASILGRMTPEGYVRYAAREIQKYNEAIAQPKLTDTMKNFFRTPKKVPELTKDQVKYITDEMTKINKMADGTDKLRALNTLSNEVRKWIPSSIYDKITSVWKAGLLTGIKTSGLNISSNFSNALAETAKDVPASIVDNIVSWFTGKRTLVATGKNSLKGAAEGVQKGWDFMKTGFDERNALDKLDFRKVNFGNGKIGKVLQKYTDTVFGVLGAEDQPFYYAARARSLGSQALAAAKNEGLKGKEALKFAQKLIESPTDTMLKYATLDAETAVFQQSSGLAKAGKKAQSLFGQVILPFAKTPANVADAMINYSPAGLAKTIIKNIGKGRFDQRLFSQGIGRGLTGTAVLAIGGALYNAGMMALNYPTGEKERKQWELEGKSQNSIKVGGKWRNVGVLGPLGMVAIVGGHLQRGIKNTGSVIGGIIDSIGGAGTALTDQSFLSGVNKTIDALNDPQRSFTGWASSLAGSVVPTIIADFARATDQYERRNTNPLERMASRVPGLRTTLEPQVTIFGEDKKTPNFFEAMMDPTRPAVPAEDPNSPAVKELKRLQEVGYSSTPTQLGPNKGYGSLTPQYNTFMWRLAGEYTKQAISDAMSLPEYENYDDEIKAKIIKEKVDDANVWARARTVFEALKGLSTEEKDKKLKEMADEKLLTQQVYKVYLSIKK